MKQFFNLHLKEKLAIVSTLLMFVVVILLIVIHAYLNIGQSKEMAQKYLEAITEGATETVDCWLREKKNLIGLISESERVRDIIAGKTANISSLLNMPSLRHGLYECFFIADSGWRSDCRFT